MAAVMALGFAATPALAQAPTPTQWYSTHDSSPLPLEGSLVEGWVDAKSPGDGRLYSVGTIQVVSADATSTFSGAGCPSSGVGNIANGPVQVVVLQVTRAGQVSMGDSTNQGIEWQTTYFGRTGGDQHVGTNARAISVWAAPEAADTRIAICGETYDVNLPASQDTSGNPYASATTPAGFIAVFDGDGNLLWSHHFFGSREGGIAAVTDVSIRYDHENDEDIVTYCGITTYGNPVSNAWLTTSNAYTAPTSPSCSHGGGSSDNGLGNWDGFVGRLRADHDNPTPPTTPDFQAIVGGQEQDGLFGIAEIEADRFVVVGGTKIAASPGTSGLRFPLTNAVAGGTCLSTPTAYGLGTVSAFRVASGSLVLDDSWSLGAPGEAVTLARDVHVARETSLLNNSDNAHTMFVVGSTTDVNLLASVSVAFQGPVATYQGGSDGFLLAFAVDLTATAPVADLAPLFGTFVGDEGDEGLTGVNGWNEYVDHVAVVGWTNAGADLLTASYMVTVDPGVPLVTLTEMSTDVLARNGNDFPAALGALNATTAGSGLAFNLNSTDSTPISIGNTGSGGVAVDERYRVNALGSTTSTNYPVTIAPYPVGRAKSTGADAVRTTYDMLPAGIARTDLTGDFGEHTSWGVTPPSPAYGGTTPYCALGRFGKPIGETAPQLPRMLLDWESVTPGAGVPCDFVIDRAPANSTILGALVVIGFPATPGPLVDPVLTGVEMWVDSTAAVTSLAFNSSASTRFSFGLLPSASPIAFSVQVVALLSTTVTCPSPGSTTHDYIASPALFFSY